MLEVFESDLKDTLHTLFHDRLVDSVLLKWTQQNDHVQSALCMFWAAV